MILIFDKKNDSFVMSANTLPSEMYADKDKYVIVDMPNGEDFDPSYSYTHKDGLAVKGDLIKIDKNEEKRLEDEWKSEQYARDRVEEYPDITEQLDDLYHNGIDGWKATIKAIKDKHPKGGS